MLAWSFTMWTAAASVPVNDVHSRLNPTTVAGIVQPRDVLELQRAVRSASERKSPVAVAGGRHAMGGQQFAGNALLIDMTAIAHATHSDPARGLIEMEGGAQWPAVIRAVLESGGGRWAIRQKQTGAD